MKISVVTISYNQGAYLERAIRSVLTQSYKNFEYIIIDGGSTDNSLEVITRYAKHLKYWVCEPDLGPANALNKGFEKAEGHLFYYLNSDDELLPNAFEKIIRFFSKNPTYDVCYGHGYMIDMANKRTGLILSDKWDITFYVQGEVSIVQPATFIKKDIFYRSSGFNEENQTCWDGELLVNLALIGARFYRINTMLCNFRVHSQAISSQLGNQKMAYALDCNRIREFVKHKIHIKLYPKVGLKLLKLFKDPLVMCYRLYSKLSPKPHYYGSISV